MEVKAEESKSPPSCPKTVTVRRNPHRRARNTPFTNIPVSLPRPTPVNKNGISSFPMEDILSIDVKENPEAEPVVIEGPVSENLNVYLRIRPVVVQSGKKGAKIGADNLQVKNAWPRNPRAKSTVEKKVKRSSETCITVNDSHSITLLPPAKLQTSRRIKSEVYDGFSHVFSAEASQKEVYEKMVNPLVDDFIRGKSRMLAALGPSGSGKTHTIFGTGKDPGMVTLALRQLFSEDAGKTKSSRCFYLSMFEISSEKGKSEKIFDLSQDRTDLCSQQTSIKGVQETRVYDIQQAESIIASGLLRRATAMTNSNSQSSRSQCIINIRCGHKKVDGEVDENSNSSVLTIVDLAGAERERKTGNQGARLLESNFINNTSMVIGQCLRSLLEHQKNPKKPLQKHFQNSMLTRYLRDYLEGKKRMALLLTARPEGEDYLDNSYLLRQASPYTKIKFDCIEEPVNLNCNKRPSQRMPMSEQLKRMKIDDIEACSSGGIKMEKSSSLLKKELTAGGVDDVKLTKARVSPRVDRAKIEKKDREYQVLLGFSKAMWNLLKEYKKKLEVAENETHCLREELKNFRSQQSSEIVVLAEVPSTEDHQSIDAEEVNSELSSCQLKSSNPTGNKEFYDHIVTGSRSCTGGALVKENCCQDDNDKFVLKKSFEDTASVEDLKLQDVEAENTYSNCEAPGVLMDSCLCTDQDDEKYEERTDSILMKSTTKSCQLPNYGSCQLQNEVVVKDDENETCTLREGFKDLKCQPVSQIVASSEVSSTEDPCSIDPEELVEVGFSCKQDAENETHTLPEEFKDLKSEHLSQIKASSEGSSTEDPCSIDPEEDAENESYTLQEEFKDLKSEQLSQIIASSEVSSTEDRCSIDPKEDAENETCTLQEEFKDLKSEQLSQIKASSEVSSTEDPCSIDPEEDAENETYTLQEEFKDLESENLFQIVASSEVSSTEDPCSIDPEEFRKSPEDPKLKDVEVEDTSLECKTPRVSINSCQCTDQEDEKAEESIDSTFVEFTANSPLPSDNIRFQPQHEEGKKLQHAPMLETDDVRTRNHSCDDSNASEAVLKNNSTNTEKPKRRLLPASSILLKDIGTVDFKDENERAKGTKGEKKAASAINIKNRSEGSLSLLRLLMNQNR